MKKENEQNIDNETSLPFFSRFWQDNHDASVCVCVCPLTDQSI